MFTDIINKQAFEFTCKTESIARRIQDDIESHTMIRLNRIIETVFSETVQDNKMLLKVDKLEIDLGDITEGDIDSDEVLSKFHHMFSQKINDLQSTYIINRTISIKREDVGNFSSENQNELELLHSLIVTGDVPWWVDKNDKLDIDSIVKDLADKNSEAFKKLLEAYKVSPELLSRLFNHVKAATFSKVIKWLPEFSGMHLKKEYIDESAGLELNTLSVEQIKNLKKFFKKHTYNSYEKIKYRLAAMLIQLLSSPQINKLSVEGSMLELLMRQFEIEQLMSSTKNYKTSKTPIKKDKITAAVNRLTVFEAEFLLFELSHYFEAHGLLYNYSNKPGSVIHKFSPLKHDNYTEENITRKEESSEGFAFNKVSEIFIEKNSAKAISIEKSNESLPGDKLKINNSKDEQPINDLTKVDELKKAHPGSGKHPAFDKIESQISFSEGQEKKEHDHDLNIIENKIPLAEEVAAKERGYAFGKMITFVMKKLKTSNAGLCQYLQTLDNNQLEHLTGIFKKREHEKRDHIQAINALLKHSFLFKYNILNVLNYLPAFEKGNLKNNVYSLSKKKLKKGSLYENNSVKGRLQPLSLFSTAKQLSQKNLFILKDILQKGGFDTDNEKNIVKKILLKLSHENILLLKFLTELPTQEIERVLPLAASKEIDRFYSDKKQKNVYIENAGLCLVAVYLPNFFKQLKYLEGGKFKNIQFAIRAIYILQYIVYGNCKAPEYLLQFNKLICSFQIEEPILVNIRLTKKEKEEADNLIASVVQNWKSLKNTSVKAFRESFLQRKGSLYEEEDSWTLRVEKKGYDLLLDTIPWSYNFIKFPWMEKFIRVDW